MPTYPSNVATVQVTRTWTKSDGSGHPASGIVTFVPNAVLEDGTSTPPVGLLPTPLTAVLDANGSISVEVMANDDSHLSPTGWSYIVTENVAGYPLQTYLQQFKAANSPVDLATLAPLATPPAQVAYVAASAVGAPSGVASLDASGHVPATQLANAPVQSVNGHTGTVVLAASDIGAVASTAVGTAGGVASLDANGHVPQAQLATAIGISLVNALIFGS